MNRIWLRLVLYGTLLGVISIGFGFSCPWQADLYKSGSSGLPGQVTSPDPADGETNVPINQQLGWAAASDATSYDVYFGTSPPPFKINTTGTSYNPGTLSSNTIYYWSIDSVNPAGTTEGNLWDFQTASTLPDLVKTWGESLSDRPAEFNGPHLAIDDANNIYLAGETNNFGAGSVDALLLKYNSAGTVQWAKTWGCTTLDRTHALALDTAGNIYVTGHTTRTGTTNTDCFVLKYLPDGTLQQARTWGGTNIDKGISIAVYGSNVYVCGETTSFEASNWDVFLIKYDSSLTAGPVWEKRWGSTGAARTYAIALDDSGDIYLTGVTDIGENNECFLIKYDHLTDNLLWEKTWGGGDEEIGYSVTVDGGYVYVAGCTYSFGEGSEDCVLLKYDASDGDLVWATQKVWGAGGTDTALSVAVDPSTSNIYVTGISEGFGETVSLILLKYDSDGNLLDEKVWYDGADEHTGATVLVKDLNLYLGGFIYHSDTPWPANYTDGCSWHDVTGTPDTPAGNDGTVDYGQEDPAGTDDDVLGDPDRTITSPTGDETGAGQEDFLLIRIEK